MPDPEAVVLDLILEEAGHHHGFPFHSATDKTRPLILAKGAPLSNVNGYGADNPLSWYPKEPTAGDPLEVKLINSWRTKSRCVSILKDERGLFIAKRSSAASRLRILLNSMVVRCGVAGVVDSEIKAQQLLRTKINESQWDSFALNGMFPETSRRSGVTYILRRGLPTLAMRISQREGGEHRHFLVALCLHSLAYYESTFVGCYPPSDDIILHLLMIRSDERRFWARSEHHSLSDPRSGV